MDSSDTVAADRPVALVTGASRGIGRAIAIELGRTHHILAGGRDAAAVDAVVARLPSAEPFVADLAGDTLPPLPGRLDVLVHSAGVEDGGTVEETDAETWRHVFELNVFAVAELTRRALPALRAAGGLVVAINSGSGLASSPGGGVYAASKFALRALTDALREEERPRGVRVSSIHPGRVDTDMQRALVAREGNEYDTEFTITPEMVAATVRTVVDLPPTPHRPRRGGAGRGARRGAPACARRGRRRSWCPRRARGHCRRRRRRRAARRRRGGCSRRSWRRPSVLC